MRCGRKTGTREPMRTISTCGISRSRLSSSSRILGASTSGSPPESSTSRTCGVRLRYSICSLEFGAREGGRGVADDARAGAVAAVGGALGGDQHQHPVRVAVHQPGHGRVAVFGQRVFHHGGEGHQLARGGMTCLRTGSSGSSGSISEMK